MPNRPIVVYSDQIFLLDPMQCVMNIWTTGLCTWVELFHKWKCVSIAQLSLCSGDQLVASSASHITSLYVCI